MKNPEMLKYVTGDIRTKNMFKHSFKNYLIYVPV